MAMAEKTLVQIPVTPAAAPAQKRKFWLTDFTWRDGRLLIRKTGIALRIDRAVVAEIASWAVWLAILNTAAFWARVIAGERRTLWFAPDCPRPWYLMRGAAMWAGFDVAVSPSEASAAVYFDDSTIGEPALPATAHRLNFACTDISKGHVARVFEEVFGYPLALDPKTASGEIVEKPEKNGVHGGRIVTAPLPAKAGFAYQRVVDTRDDNGCCNDLRTPCVGGEPVVVWIKTKTPEGRFSINNRKAVLRTPAEVFSQEELNNIRRFTARMGLDWGGLDILRDRGDARIYIVDVNKTDLGPVIALSWRDKIRSLNRLAAALKRLVT